MTTDVRHFRHMKSRIFHSFTAKLAVAFWILTGLAAIWCFWPASVDRGVEIVTDETTSVSESDSGFTIPIEKITVGMRVHAHNPELSDPERETIVEPDWSTFSVLDVEMTKTDGGIVEISLLRSPEWIEQHKPVVGGTVPVASAEFDAMGESKVIAVRAGPEVNNGPGHVVTATFKHLSSEVLDLYVEGNDMPLGTTANHPFWSVDRKRFVEASKLRRGETLRTMFDENLKLRFINKRISKEPVYNFTVFGEHTYFVGDDALLVHNNGGYDGNATRKYKHSDEFLAKQSAFQKYVDRQISKGKKPQLIRAWSKSSGYTAGIERHKANLLAKKQAIQNHHLVTNKMVSALNSVGFNDAQALRKRTDLQYFSSPGGHIGYDSWHRAMDSHMVRYITRQGQSLNEEKLLRHIHEFYQQPEAMRRIPGVDLGY